MRKILSFIFSTVHYLIMGFFLCLFHPIQVIAFNLFGYKAHKFTVDFLNLLLVYNFYTLLCRPVFKGFNKLPKNKPLIIVANHQSMYDISPVVWGFRKHHAKFISKKELGKNLPSISYNLRKGGSVLIDRKNGSQSIKEILKLGRKMEDQNWSVCLFPEGTRTRDGNLRKFQSAGFKTLLKASPNALVVPFVINGNYNLHKWGQFPLNIGLKLQYTALQPIERGDMSDDEVLEAAREMIHESLKN